MRATSWRDRSITALITSQGAIIGLVGAAVGLIVAITVMALAFGTGPTVSALPVVIVLVAAVLTATAAAFPVARRQATPSLASSLAG